MGRWIESLKGLEVIVTGDFRKTTLGMRQSDVEHELRSRGAVVVADIRRTTELLIRADSPLWKYGDYGAREAELAGQRGRSSDGVVVDVDGLVALLDGLAVWARDPLSAPPKAEVVGAPYRSASASVGGDLKLVERDPAAMERALAGHARTQNHLADFLARRGLTPLSPVVSTIQFDLAWEAGSQIWVA